MPTQPRPPVPTATLLSALGARPEAMRREPWTSADLSSWAALTHARDLRLAIARLETAGLVEAKVSAPAPRTGRSKPLSLPAWRLTTAGVEAAKEAAAKRASERRLSQRQQQAIATDSFELRLWRLFRIRQVMTPAEAAECLVDAGADVLRAMRSSIQHFRRWHGLAPSAVSVSAQKVDGHKRYVLLKDLGPLPPCVPETAPSQAGRAP